MANKTLFKTTGSKAKSSAKIAPVPDTKNYAGGKAYSMSDKHALAQIAATNTFRGTYYASSEENLRLAKEYALKLLPDPEFLAKVALYSRSNSYMKDMPAFLAVVLADTNTELFRRIFSRVIDNGKMLRNFVQMARSGVVTGRKFNMSAGACRRAIQAWFDSRSPYQIFRASVGNDPTLQDILRMARPKPNSAEKEALFGYLLGKDYKADNLPAIVTGYELYKKTRSGDVPNVDFRQLDSLGLTTKEWTEIARNAKWQMTRMNLNTFARHGVYGDKAMVKLIADRLRNADDIKGARQFPYQLYSAWTATRGTSDLPFEISEALQDAMEISIDNVPTIDGQVYVCVDTSGSMGSAVIGAQAGGKTSKIRCVDVAALMVSAVARKNRSAEIWTFSNDAVKVEINPRDTVLTNTQRLCKAGGGTDVSSGLRKLNQKNAMGAAVIYVSDYESWIDSGHSYSYRGTGMLEEWNKFKARNPEAKLVCIDLTPRPTSQVKEHKDILQVGGFSDQVFEVVASFVKHGDSANHWVSEIEKMSLEGSIPVESTID